MEYTKILGSIACLITVIYTAIGLSSQIIYNYKFNTARSLTSTMLLLMCMTFASWVAYGLYIQDYYILLPNSIGAVLSFLLVLQKLKNS